MPMQPFLMPELIWPCWAYALQRINSGIALSAEWMDESLPGMLKPYTPSQDNPDVGDILVWKLKNPKLIYAPVFIDSLGHVISRRIAYAFHAAVYEGMDVITDMAAPKDSDWPLPFQIRMRLLSERPAPDNILKGLQNLLSRKTNRFLDALLKRS